MSRLPPRRTGLREGRARTGLQRGGGKHLTDTQRAKRHKKRPSGNFLVTYALTQHDITRNELGRFRPMPLNQALKASQRMLKGAYIQVTITKIKP